MIISHARRFIFFKTIKTASTSLEIALAPHCGPEDVITPVSPADERIRRELGARGPQNYLTAWRDYGLGDWRALLGSGNRRKRHWNHQTAAELVACGERDIMERYFTFAFIRHPYDRILSLYHFQFPDSATRPSLDEYLRRQAPHMARVRGHDVCCDRGRPLVDRLYLYEELPDALADIAERLQLPRPLDMPRTKHRFRTDRRHWSSVLTEDQCRRIQQILPEDCAFYAELGRLETGPPGRA